MDIAKASERTAVWIFSVQSQILDHTSFRNGAKAVSSWAVLFFGEIRMCRFLIADLTCGNQGAYWEAGYAEGLGKPVIYTCNKSYFDKEGTHFDTNHHQTVLWDPARLEQ
jgi:nucleoside 2-deoxyribosyltransferase